MAELLRGLHPEIKRKVRATLAGILENPDAGKALKGELQGLRSVRIARLRVVYRIGEGGMLDIVAFGPRHRIYEETLRLVRREER